MAGGPIQLPKICPLNRPTPSTLPVQFVDRYLIEFRYTVNTSISNGSAVRKDNACMFSCCYGVVAVGSLFRLLRLVDEAGSRAREYRRILRLGSSRN